MCANVRLDTKLTCTEIRDGLNRNLPDDICVTDVSVAGDRFHARYNAKGKTYRYTCYAGELKPDVKDIVTVKPGIYKEINGLEMETVPAYNTIKPFHPKRAEWVGYILRVNGKRIYIAGDTGATKEARQVKCDIALLPI